MGNRHIWELRRREFLLTLAAAAAPLSPLGKHALAEVQAPGEHPARPKLLVESSVSSILTGGDAPETLRAIAYAMLPTGGTAEDVVERSQSIIAKSENLPKRDLIRGLSQTFSQSDFAQAIGGTMIPSSWAFEGIIGGNAALALVVSGIASRASAYTSQYDNFVRTLPMPPDLERATRGTVSAMMRLTSDPRFRSIVDDPRFQKISRLNLNESIPSILARLPDTARRMAQDVLNIGFDGRPGTNAKLDGAVRAGVAGVIEQGKAKYQAASQAISAKGSSFNTERNRLQSVTNDVDAVAAIGTFVLRHLMRDGEAANRFSRGMQLTTTALTIGLMASTGGVGSLALVNAITSGVGPLEQPRSEGLAAREIYRALSEQIESVRKEMHDRFDRLERVELQALDLLFEISGQLRDYHLSISSQMKSLQDQIARLQNSSRRESRSVARNSFSAKVQQAKGLIEKPENYNYAYKNDLLSDFLNHAIDVSLRPSFVSDPGGIADTIRECGRADFAIGQLGSAARLLNLRNVRDFRRNPVEWARGVQAYLELHSSIDFESQAVRDRAVQAWEIGRELRMNFLGLCTQENVAIATKRYREVAEQLQRSTIETSMTSMSVVADRKVKRPPRVGWLRESRIAPEVYLLSEHEQHPVKYAHYISKLDRGGWHADYSLNRYRVDPIAIAFEAGVIDFRDKGREPLSLRPTHYTQSTYPMGEQKVVAILNRKNEEIGELRVWEINVPENYFKFPQGHRLQRGYKLRLYYDFGPPLDGKPEAYAKKARSIWNKVFREFDDAADVKPWAESLRDQLPRGLIETFDETAAAFALYTTFVAWVVSGQLEDPWRSGLSSQLWRSTQDVIDDLVALGAGAEFDHRRFFLPIHFVAKSDFVPGTASSDAYIAVYNKLSSQRKREPIYWPDFGYLVYYPTLVNTVFSNKLNAVVQRADKLGSELRATAGAVDLVDRTMTKLSAFLAEGTG